MSPDFEANLNKLADVIVRIGINLRAGQRVLISNAPLELAPLARLIVAKAYQSDARLVEVFWSDEEIRLTRHRYAPRDSFDEFPVWRSEVQRDFAAAGDAIVYLYAQDPDLLAQENQSLINQELQAGMKAGAAYSELISKNATNWLVATGAVSGWARKLFPDLDTETGVARLWEIIFDISRVRGSSPVEDWREHIHQLGRRSEYLTHKRYRALHYTAPGTDLTIGLPDGHVWVSGGSTAQNGVTFVANIPTEEVFTLPQKDRVDGVVTSTKPLPIGGTVVEDFQLTFSGGKVVDVRARQGQNMLTQMLDTDEGARRLGEVALVPHSSPISQTGILFYNALIDENAACHLALGRAYQFALEGGADLTADEFANRGGNVSKLHMDFMIGSGQLDIDGVTDSGDTEPVMRAGEWAFEV